MHATDASSAMHRLALIASLSVAAALAGCDMLGGESAEKVAAAREADGRAIGSACRHAGRAIEDCYALNKKAERASVFAGWRDMNDYMRENKIDAVAPQLGPAPKAESKAEGKTEDKAEKPDKDRAEPSGAPAGEGKPPEAAAEDKPPPKARAAKR